ncbi:MAG TPA: phosphatase PAP2 family protein [Bacteroidales bacterium]
MKSRFLSFFLLFLTLQLSSQSLDIKLLRYINSPNDLQTDNFFKFVSNSTAFVIVGLPVGMGVAGLIKHDDELFRNACATLTATAIGFGVSEGLKYIIKRDRPFIPYPDINPKAGDITPTFPSSHTTTAFATATSLSLAYPKWYIIVPSYTWASAVGYSRMALGVHYPSDILAGAIIGSGSAWLTHYVNKKLSIRAHKKP